MEDQAVICYSALCGLAAGAMVWFLIPRMKHLTLQAGLKGKDLGKKGTPLEHVEVCVRRCGSKRQASRASSAAALLRQA